jgi:hypothetical protein
MSDDDQPVNFEHILESVEMAMECHDEIPDGAVSEIRHTVEEAVANNEDYLMWREDYEEFMGILDGILDGVYDNGYSEQVSQLDDLREKMEPKDD